MKYLLVLQLYGKSLKDFDELVELEDAIVKELNGLVEWNGHDFGSGEGNIFFETDEPQRSFKAIKEFVGSSLSDMRIAYRDKDSEVYSLLYPPDAKEFTIK